VTTASAHSARRGDTHRVASGTSFDNYLNVSPNRSIAVLTMNEALARARMRTATEANPRTRAVRPARLVAMTASKLRNRA
jgi:hypothetical protein